jgi:hypothetical protein
MITTHVSTTPSSPLSPRLSTEVTSRVGGEKHFHGHASTSLSPQNLKWDTWINNAKESDPLNPLQQPCHFRFLKSLMTLWRMSIRNPTMPALTLSSWPSTKSMATSSPISQAASLSHLTVTTHMLLSSTSLTPTRFDPFPSRIAPKKNFFVHTARSMIHSHYAVSNLSYTNFTMKHQRMLKHLLPQSKLASSTLPWTSIAQTPPNVPHAHVRIIFLPEWQAFQNLSPSPTGAASQRNATSHSTCYVCVIKILFSWHMNHSRGHSLSMPHPWLP